MEKDSDRKEKEVVNVDVEQGCFVCHGTGHWARECTSLPSIYLTDDAPKCYRCGGIGHFARFCPTSEKQFRHRERRASLPSLKFPVWGNYYGELTNLNFSIPQIPDQIFLVRPEYMDIPRADDKFDYYEMMSDCSSVEFIVEDEDSPVDISDDNNNNNDEEEEEEYEPFIIHDHPNHQSKENLIEISIETPK